MDTTEPMPHRRTPPHSPARAVSRAERALVAAVLLGSAAFMADTGPGPAGAQSLAVAQSGTQSARPGPASPMIDDSLRREAEAALRGMGEVELHLTYARLHAAFHAHIGDDDLRPARALIDYARLAETELMRRGFSLPAGTDPAAEMLRLYELVL